MMSDSLQADKKDKELLFRIVDGSFEAFNEFYEIYYIHLYNYILRLIKNTSVSEEVLQEVFVSVWLGAKKFWNRSSVKTWVFRIAHNKSVSWLRKKRLLAPLLDNREPTYHAGEEKCTELDVDKRILADRIHSALNKLSPKHRAVIELSFYYGFSYKEIAHIMKCPIGTVKSRMSYAIKYLKQDLNNENWTIIAVNTTINMNGIVYDVWEKQLIEIAALVCKQHVTGKRTRCCW